MGKVGGKHLMQGFKADLFLVVDGGPAKRGPHQLSQLVGSLTQTRKLVNHILGKPAIVILSIYVSRESVSGSLSSSFKRVLKRLDNRYVKTVD
jgi:hypothetical protein